MVSILYLIIQGIELLLIARIVLSWLQIERKNQFTIQICELVDPILEPLRRNLPLTFGGIDFSPMIIFMVLNFIKNSL
jgi:YggT family protein